MPPSLTSPQSGMTLLQDATAPGIGTATGSAGTNVAALFDNTSTTQVTFDSATPTVEYQFPQPEKVSYYTLTSGSVAGDPEDWVVQGSSDGSTWTTLDTRTGQTFADRLQTQDFQIADPRSFSYYRIMVTGDSGTPATTLSEIQLMVAQRLPPCPSPSPRRQDLPAGSSCLQAPPPA